jgi:hypothetical protein
VTGGTGVVSGGVVLEVVVGSVGTVVGSVGTVVVESIGSVVLEGSTSGGVEGVSTTAAAAATPLTETTPTTATANFARNSVVNQFPTMSSSRLSSCIGRTVSNS